MGVPNGTATGPATGLATGPAFASGNQNPIRIGAGYIFAKLQNLLRSLVQIYPISIDHFLPLKATRRFIGIYLGSQLNDSSFANCPFWSYNTCYGVVGENDL